jgi:hypothetical protein
MDWQLLHTHTRERIQPTTAKVKTSAFLQNHVGSRMVLLTEQAFCACVCGVHANEISHLFVAVVIKHRCHLFPLLIICACHSREV